MTSRNTAIISLVCLVAITGIVALVSNSLELTRLVPFVGTGEAPSLLTGNVIASPVSAPLSIECGEWVGNYRVVAAGKIGGLEQYRDKIVLLQAGRPPSIWLSKGDTIPGTNLALTGISGEGYCAVNPWYPSSGAPVEAILTFTK
ncbi:hypothetical protein GOV11_03735 [Candidatus Woesearchaeota archaeon]|nr:hypothetical protein [Candidatus Woesearchaeota archaeon]